jgi:hypothetical protein
MTTPLMPDGRELHPISAATYAFVQAYLPRCPLDAEPLWVGDTCWVPTYTGAAMRLDQFAGWECLNPREETPDA